MAKFPFFDCSKGAHDNKSIRQKLKWVEDQWLEIFLKKPKAEVFWPFEKKWGLAPMWGKDRWEKRKGKTEKAEGTGWDVLDMSLKTEVGRLTLDRDHFCCAVKIWHPIG